MQYSTLWYFLEQSLSWALKICSKILYFSFLLAYSLDGLLVFSLLFICTCAYFRKVPRLRTWLLSEKKGVWGVFYKAAVIGSRLHLAVALSCFAMAFYVLFIKWNGAPVNSSLCYIPSKLGPGANKTGTDGIIATFDCIYTFPLLQ